MRREPDLAWAISARSVSSGMAQSPSFCLRKAIGAVLHARGLQRRVVLSVPHFLFVIEVLLRTALVAMLPERLVRAHPGLKVCAPPVAMDGYEMAMLWHERVHRDPGASLAARAYCRFGVKPRATLPFSGCCLVGAASAATGFADNVCRG